MKDGPSKKWNIADVAFSDYIMMDLKEEFLSHPCLSSDLADPFIGSSACKHLSQQSSLLAHLGGCGLLDPSKVSCFVEFGAGRGKLTHCIHRAIQYSTVSPYTCLNGW